MILRFTKQDGVVIPLVASIIVMILALAGLAVDAGNLYYRRLQLQKALDASVSSGAKALSLIPYKDRDGRNNNDASLPNLNETVARDSAVRLAAQDTIEANLYFLDPLEIANIRDILSKPAGAAGYLKIDGGNNDVVSAKIEIEVPLLFMRFVPGILENSKKLTVFSKVQVERAMVAVILDDSASMMCPINPAIDCKQCTRAINCRSFGDIKIDILREAVVELYTTLNYDRDLLQLTLFAKGATTNFKMSLSPPGINLTDLSDKIYNDTIAASTNPTAGIIAAYDTSREIVKKMQRGNIAYVIFSDGAPNAARFKFANPIIGLPDFSAPLNPGQKSPTDFYSWWLRDVSGKINPIELVKGEIPWNWRIPEAPTPYTEQILNIRPWPRQTLDLWLWPQHELDTKPEDLSDSRTLCGSPVRIPNTFIPEDDQGNPTPEDKISGNITDLSFIRANPANAFNGCLQDFSFEDLNGKIYKGDVAKVPFKDFIKQYYNVFIAQADALRDSGGTVYTIGVGLPAPDTNDPYQIAENFDLRKDFLLARVANDPSVRTIPALNNLPNNLVRYVPASDAHLAVGAYLKIDTYDPVAFAKTFAVLGDKIIRKVKTVKMIPQEWCEFGMPCD